MVTVTHHDGIRATLRGDHKLAELFKRKILLCGEPIENVGIREPGIPYMLFLCPTTGAEKIYNSPDELPDESEACCDNGHWIHIERIT